MPALPDLLGRVHPLLIHFPIALLWVAALWEVFRIGRDSPFLARGVIWLLALGALGAVAAAGSGWLLGAHAGLPKDLRVLLIWHRWLGLGTATLAVIAWAAALRWAETPFASRRWLRRLTVIGTAGLVSITAHLGALMVWGTDWFS